MSILDIALVNLILAQLFFCKCLKKMAAGSHFECPQITFDGISYHFRSITHFFYKMATCGHFGCPKITFDFWPFPIDKELSFENFDKMVASGHFGCPKITFDRISGHFIDTELFFLIFDKMVVGGILDGMTMSIIELIRDIWMNNACVKFEECSLNTSKVIALTTKL